MKLYSVLVKKNQEGKIIDFVLVKDGFSIYAFLFSGLWFLHYKMWSEFFILLFFSTALAFVESAAGLGPERFILEIFFVFIVAMNANFWLSEHYKNNGYEFVEVVFGSNWDSAMARYIRRSEAEFDDAILDPKLCCRMMKLKKMA